MYCFNCGIRIVCFWCLLLIFGSAAGSVAFHHVIPALCSDSQHSAPLLNHASSIASETVPISAVHWTAFKSFVFLFLDIGACVIFPSVFNILPSYLLSSSVCLSTGITWGRNPVPPQALLVQGTPPTCRTTSLLTCMNFTWNTTKDRGRKKRAMRNRVVGRGSTR